MIRRPLAVFAPPALLVLCLALLFPAALIAQGAPASPPPADPADVESVDAIIDAVYESISGAAGEERDWDRFRSLFIPEAQLIPTGGGPGQYQYQVVTPETFVNTSGTSMERNGFFEREIHRVEERFGPVVHLFSTYESRRAADEPEPFQRGINSFQLFHDGQRWWIVSIYWSAENPDRPIPERYLPG